MTIEYTVSDDGGGTTTGTATITVTGTNDAPVAVPDTAAGTENQRLTIDVLANDLDPDKNDNRSTFELEVIGVSGGGTATVAGRNIRFEPGSDFDYLATGETTTVTVTYSLTDSSGAGDTSTATITVTGTNDAPVAVADLGAGTENQTVTIDVLANDTDIDDDPSVFSLDAVSISKVSGAVKTGGSVSIVNNELVFDPGTDFDELDTGDIATVTIEYTVSDDGGGTTTGTATITVTGTNDAPVAVARHGRRALTESRHPDHR